VSAWKKAVALAADDKERAEAETCMARGFAEQKKYRDAAGYLDQAMQIYTQLGGVTPDFAEVYADVTAKSKPVEPTIFGDAGAKTLNDNSAKVSMQKLQEGTAAHVDILAPARFVTEVKNEHVDQVGFEKAVSFDLLRDTAGNTVMSNIKGFRVHLPEKRLWVNLFNLVVKPANGSGNLGIEATGGKAGITKTVESEVAPDMVAPLDALAKSASELGTAKKLDLPLLGGSLTDPVNPPADGSAQAPAQR
jgi:hypothetical protein